MKKRNIDPHKAIARMRASAAEQLKWLREANQGGFAGSWLNYYHDSPARKKEKRKTYNADVRKWNKKLEDIQHLLNTYPELEAQLGDFNRDIDAKEFIEQSKVKNVRKFRAYLIAAGYKFKSVRRKEDGMYVVLCEYVHGPQTDFSGVVNQYGGYEVYLTFEDMTNEAIIKGRMVFDPEIVAWKNHTPAQIIELIDDMTANINRGNICTTDSESKLKALGILNSEGSYVDLKTLGTNDVECIALAEITEHINNLW